MGVALTHTHGNATFWRFCIHVMVHRRDNKAVKYAQKLESTSCISVR